MPSAKKRGKKERSPLDGYTQHGLALTRRGSQGVGTCPFCGREDKFAASVVHGAWDCKVCGKHGNLKTFLAEKTVHDQEGFRGKVANRLAKDRGLRRDTLRAWRVGWDGRQYTIPVDLCGKMYDLRRYGIGDRMRATTGGNVSLVGAPANRKSKVVWLCEGEWDGMALWECLQANGIDETVWAVTGGTSFPAHAIPYFEGKEVRIVFDNDPTGQHGAERVRNMLTGVAASMTFVWWPEKLPKGYDVRDLYKKRGTRTVAVLRKMLQAHPQGAVVDTTASNDELDGKGLAPAEVTRQYRKWLFLPDDEMLAVMFGTVFANRLDGDPVWLFLVGPPGSCKTELLISLTGTPKTTSTSTLSSHALISGAANVGTADPSLIPKLNGKVLVVKDFTPIINMPSIERDEIFSTLRDAYDGKTEKYWGTGLHRTYNSRFGLLAGVTPVIEMFGPSGSMLGERFLKYRLPQSGRVRTGETVIEAALDNIGKETRMREELQATAYEVLNRPIDAHEVPTIPKAMRRQIIRLAQWVAVLRGVVARDKYTHTVQFKPSPEVGTRVAKQLARLGMGVALYLHKDRLDETAYQIVVNVARSTVPNKVEEVVKQLYLKSFRGFARSKDVAEWARLPEATVRDLLADLELLRIVQREKEGQYTRVGWRLSRTVLRMMRPLHLYGREESWATKRRKVRKAAGRSQHG